MLLAEKLLRPTLARAEADLGRRSPFTAHAGGAAGRGGVGAQPARPKPAALLANRLDVLERSGLPEAVLLGFRTLARIAAPKAPSTARSSCWARSMRSACARSCRACASPAWRDQVRLHARRFRAETCRDLCAQIDALLADARAAARAALAAQRRAAARAGAGPRGHRGAGLARGAGAAGARRRRWRRQLKQGRLHIELLGLRALALDRCGEKCR